MDEINDIGNVIANTIDNKGEDKRNFFGILRAQRGATDLYNISGDSLNLLNEAYKSNKIGADEYKEGLRNIIEATGNDLGLNVSLVYLDTSTMPKDSKGSIGAAYIDKETGRTLIPINTDKIGSISELLGTVFEEISHIRDGLAGRQDKKVADDKSNNEKGLESLGRPSNDYAKKKFEKNDSSINLTTDQYHIVWCVKYRRKVLIDDIEKTLKELLIEIINRKLEYIGKNIIKIDTFKVKASQLNHSPNEYEKKSLSKRWVEILGNKIQRDLYSAFLIKNVKENLEEVNIEKAQKEFKNFVKLHNEEIERIKKGNVKTLKCMGF